MKAAVFVSTVALVLGGAGAHAADFGWAERSVESGSPLSHYRSSFPFGEVHSRLSFGLDRYRALDADFLGDAPGLFDAEMVEPTNVLHVYSGFTLDRSRGYLAPTVFFQSSADEPESGRLSALGATWSHRLSPVDTFGLSAGYTEFAHPDAGQEMLDTRAAMSWTSKWARGVRPGLTGSVFLGDETARDPDQHGLGRRYYGFSIGGEVTLFQRHTPYVNYRMQRSLLQATPEALGIESRVADHSLISAGWRWQVLRNWSLQAEATYSLSDNGLDLYNEDRSRVMFGTRFDFR